MNEKLSAVGHTSAVICLIRLSGESFGIIMHD